jgi:DNA topoisomerase-2
MKIQDAHNSKTESALNRKAGGRRSNRVTGIAKLEEANEAGGSRSKDCTLVLTEGDSAKTLAISGFSVVGRDFWGVFPLRGKLLNVREAAGSTILKNQEIQNIMKILRLQVGEKYTDTSKLRYGHVMIMADQDYDGSHIKGLLVNFIHHFWPELLIHCPGFLVQFITPIVKVTKKDVVKSFYSIPEYRNWQDNTRDYKDWKAKYYKGLGTSKPQEAKEYFQQLARHRIVFDYRGEEDKEAILLAFDKAKVEDRKAWVTRQRSDDVDFTQSHMTISDFIHKELVLFSRADCERSIPSMMDGFKPSQRKILFCCFKKKGMEKNEIKVAQLSGYVSEHSAYHHGEASLQGTIIGMAQDFCGSNNMNLLEPIGQFGTRIAGGKDASQARYLFTKLTPLARALFPHTDDELLAYREDDGQSVEPYWYAPVIPTVLVNGSRGIGTGYATYIPNYNPETLVEWVRCKLNGKEVPALHPWYRDFTNNDALIPEGKGYRCVGTIREVGNNGTVVNITELPIGVWTEDYKKDVIEELMTAEIIHDYREHHTDVTVDFEVQMAPETLREWRSIGLEEKFKMRSNIPVSNLVCFDHKGNIAKYDSVQDIMEEFFVVRYEYYHKRKDLLMDKVQAECEKLKNMVRFIKEVIDGALEVMKRKKKDLLADLRTRKYKPFPPEEKKTVAKGAKDYAEDEDMEGEEEVEADQSARDYDYLLGMKIWALTWEKIEELKAKLKQKEEEFNRLYNTAPKDMWLTDLDALAAAYKAWEVKRIKALSAHLKKEDSASGSSKPKGKGKQKSARLQESEYVPKQSDKSKKLSEEHAAKQAKAEEAAKRKEERELKRALKGEDDENAPKRRKKTVKEEKDASQPTLTSLFPTPTTNSETSSTPSSPSELTAKRVPDMFSKKKPAEPQSVAVDADEDMELEFPPPEPARKPPPPPKRPAQPKAATKPKKPAKKKYSSDSDEDDSDADGDDGSEDDFEEVVRPQRSTRERKPISYTLNDSESFIDDDAEDEDEDEDEDGDDDDVDSEEVVPAKSKSKSTKAPATKKRLVKQVQDDSDDGDDSFRFDD